MTKLDSNMAVDLHLVFQNVQMRIFLCTIDLMVADIHVNFFDLLSDRNIEDAVSAAGTFCVHHHSVSKI